MRNILQPMKRTHKSLTKLERSIQDEVQSRRLNDNVIQLKMKRNQALLDKGRKRYQL